MIFFQTFCKFNSFKINSSEYKIDCKDLISKSAFEYENNSKYSLSKLYDSLAKSDISSEFELLASAERSSLNEENKLKPSEADRYSDITPYKNNTVELSTKEYINSSWMHVSILILTNSYHISIRLFQLKDRKAQLLMIFGKW